MTADLDRLRGLVERSLDGLSGAALTEPSPFVALKGELRDNIIAFRPASGARPTAETPPHGQVHAEELADALETLAATMAELEARLAQTLAMIMPGEAEDTLPR
jgi:hypothetical protein